MNEAIVCKWSPAKTLAVSRAPLRELLNFLIYIQTSELLCERARKQSFPLFDKFPTTVRDLKDVLKAEKCDKNEKLFFDCEKRRHHIALLIDNQGVQFWIHYFSCGIGFVSLSFFNHLASVESSLFTDMRNVTHSHEYQWFTHDLDSKLFTDKVSKSAITKMRNYFIHRINPTLISPYTILFEEVKHKESYKFVSGSFERLKEVLTWTRFVCEGLKRKRESGGKTWVSPHITITCGNLRNKPMLEHSTERFINSVGALAVQENAPYTVLRESFARRSDGESYDWMRKKRHSIFLNLEQEYKQVPVREKIVARLHLVNWLKKQGAEGGRIIKVWKLEG